MVCPAVCRSNDFVVVLREMMLMCEVQLRFFIWLKQIHLSSSELSEPVPHTSCVQFIFASPGPSNMSRNAEASSASSAPTTDLGDSSFVDYRSMLKRTYLRHKTSDAVSKYLDQRDGKPSPADGFATIINYRAGVDPELAHYNCPLDDRSSDARPTWADEFQDSVERADSSVVIRLVLIYNASSRRRSVSFWIINYLGSRLNLEPGFFYPLIDQSFTVVIHAIYAKRIRVDQTESGMFFNWRYTERCRP